MTDERSGTGVAVDSTGRALVAGQTYSTQATFPVVIGPDLTFNGAFDAFVVRVRSDGSGLDYSGYIGGAGPDWASDIVVDDAGRAYLSGQTASSEETFPVVVGPDLTYNGSIYSDAFVARVHVDGSGLDCCGYVGGSDTDKGYGIAVDGAAQAYLTGETYSTQASFPVLAGPDLTFNGGCDAFVAKVRADGTGLIYCGYVGGSSWDSGEAIAVYGAGQVHVTGWTGSDQTSFPVVDGPDLTYNGGDDAFVAGIRTDGSGLDYCGYIGGSDDDQGTGIAVDSMGRAYVTGSTSSNETTFPVVGGPDLTYHGGYDMFVAQVAMSGPYSISGTVTDGRGDSLSGAFVGLLPEGDPGYLVTTTTDSTGTFGFSAFLQPGNYAVRTILRDVNGLSRIHYGDNGLLVSRDQSSISRLCR